MAFFGRALGRPDYGWVVLALGFVTQGLIYTVWYSFGIFFVALLSEFGWQRGPAAAAFSLFALVQSLSSPLVGLLVDRFGARVVVPTGAAIAGAGLLLASQLSSLLELYLAYGLIAAFGGALAGWIANVAVMSRWFPRAVGFATGLTSAGIGFGILVVVPLIQSVILASGWRVGYQALAALVVLGIVPANLLLQRRRPATFRAAPSEAEDEVAGQVVDLAWASRDWTLAAAARERRFWALALGCCGASFATQLVVTHQVAHLVDAGYDRALAAAVVGLMGGVSIVAKVSWGLLADRVGREITFTLGMASVVLAVGLLALAGSAPLGVLPYLFGPVMAFGYSIIGPLAPSMASDLFRGRRFAAIFGLAGLITGSGGAVGSWVAGAIFDLTGSYLAAFALAALVAVGSAALGWLAAPRKVRRPPRARPRPGTAAVGVPPAPQAQPAER
jgi:MFS family permease